MRGEGNEQRGGWRATGRAAAPPSAISGRARGLGRGQARAADGEDDTGDLGVAVGEWWRRHRIRNGEGPPSVGFTATKSLPGSDCLRTNEEDGSS